jgi:hypothetical protein
MSTERRAAPAAPMSGLKEQYFGALKLRTTDWTHPTTAPTFSLLPQEPRLPLSLVLDFLSFDAIERPSDISEMVHAAHRGRAFRALCKAARESRVALIGERISEDGGPQTIAPEVFDLPLALGHEDGTFDSDPEQVSMADYVELRERPAGWRRVRVDRTSFVNWLETELCEPPANAASTTTYNPATRQPERERARRALTALFPGFPDTVPDPATVPNKHLDVEVNNWLKVHGEKPVTQRTVRRAAGRK